jgi:hypothetical protein
MRKLFAGFLVAVILLGGDMIWRAWAQGPNTFCAANIPCTASALWNFTGGLQSGGATVATLPVNLAGGSGVVTGVLPGANMSATNLAGGNNPGGVSGILPFANLTTQGTDTNLLTSGTVSASTGVSLCTDANHGATTSGCPPGGIPVTQVDLTAQGANIGSTPILTPGANGFYRISCYIVLTRAATTSSTTPNCNVIYTDADTSVSETVLTGLGGTLNIVGAIDLIASPSGNGGIFYAKSGSAINYSTTNYVSSGATSMQYAIHIRLEGPF